FAPPEIIHQMKKLLPSWSINTAAQRVGARALRDHAYQATTRRATRELRETLSTSLGWLPGVKVFPSEANYILCRTERLDDTAVPLVEKLLANRIAIRLCDNFHGLDATYFRVAVRNEEDNQKLVEAMEVFYGTRKMPVVAKKKKKPAIMLQGTSSNAGKSVLTAALCRIFLQDGYSVAPFKAQNMSNNSFVTSQGGEMGRAQVTQAMACRLEPDVRMNPVLLKPGSDTGAQVVVMGRPVGNMDVKEYVDYKPRAFEKVRAAYDSLAAEHDIMVIEGAGSPAEINLKHHDIVNMKMAEYAEAQVLLVGDIDRGGVFASLVGTMELLDERERERVFGFILNRFRGDESLLDPAISSTYGITGKPVIGTVPYIEHLGLPEEDSVSFKDGLTPGCELKKSDRPDQMVDIAVVDLGHISNFNDLDALACEPDVNLRVVKTPLDLGEPDAVILPGSKNTVADMKALRGLGMAAALRSLPEQCQIIGICGGFQMLGAEIDDPLGLETGLGRVDGFGILPVRTTLAAEKTLTRATATHLPSGKVVSGYEIHHGVTSPLDDGAEVVIHGPDGPLGYGLASGRVWGTYLHGVFDEDEFRRWFIDALRTTKGLPKLAAPLTSYGLESALDHLASVVRQALDMNAIYRSLGFSQSAQASLLS
ncbi:MAG: cobyric acid synthase, partial [Proteobacteria bacterium]|nr:cobyric acid synthase [Pseudomonadota bacterium]MBU1610370.1 cobyric acid synthase [Pseudomonadota bacterium]